jgi:NADPH:quinone reductase-like Zn-dependent oxidoreductase
MRHTRHRRSRVVEEECPQPKSGGVRVRVPARGCLLADLLDARRAFTPKKPRLPFTPGWDLIGVLDRLATGISGVKPGHIVGRASDQQLLRFPSSPQLSTNPWPLTGGDGVTLTEDR